MTCHLKIPALSVKTFLHFFYHLELGQYLCKILKHFPKYFLRYNSLRQLMPARFPPAVGFSR